MFFQPLAFTSPNVVGDFSPKLSTGPCAFSKSLWRDNLLAAKPRIYFNYASAQPCLSALSRMSDPQGSGVAHPVSWVRVALDVPLPGPFDYRAAEAVPVGARVIVPVGRRKLVGVVVAAPEQPGVEVGKGREVGQGLRGLPPLAAERQQLTQ